MFLMAFIKEGSSLSRFSLSILLNHLTKSLNKLSVGHYIKGHILHHLRYADENAFMAPSVKHLQKLLNLLQLWYCTWYSV